MASELIVQTLKGPTSGSNANKVIIPSGQTLDASAGGMTTPTGHAIQVVHFSGNNEVSASRTVGATISATHTFTKQKESSTLVVYGYAVMRYSAGVNEGWWTVVKVKATQDGSTTTSTDLTQTSESQGGTRNRHHSLNYEFTTLDAGDVDITIFAQSDGSDWASRGYRITVMEIAG